MSKFGRFIIRCCGTFLVKRYRVKPFIKGVLREEFTELICPKCKSHIIERIRVIKKENGTLKKEHNRVTGILAEIYLQKIDELSYKQQIINTTVEKGSKSGRHWKYCNRGTVFDLNGKSCGKQEQYLKTICK